LVVLDGREIRFAQGAAMQREFGDSELVTADEYGYVRLAVCLANDSSLRATLKTRIRERMDAGSDFLNPRLYGQRVSEAFQRLFEPETRHGLASPAAVEPDARPVA
jgi:predicted O-linked N-acetylglucosamine transferase (SPINDLY family)